MTTVAIIGAGHLGGAVAQAIAARDRIDRVLLVDDSSGAAGKALDLQQAGAITGGHTRLDATGDVSRIIGCTACVVADRFAPDSPEWCGDEGLAAVARFAPYLGDCPIVFAGATQADLLCAAARELNLGRHRLVGSAPEALVAAVAAIVAVEARCSPGEVRLAALGVPPDRFVIPWSQASIGGYTMELALTQVQLTRIEARAARLWPPGPYALGAAAARVAEALVESSRRSYSVLALLGGEFGVRDRIGTLPARLSSSGIVQAGTPSLTTREKVLLETALGG